MGIYSNEEIYGIRWCIYGEDYRILKSYEKIFDKSDTNIMEARKEYDKLTINEQIIAKFYIFTSFQTTHEQQSTTYMGWMPYNIDKIHQFFTKDDIVF